MSRNSFKSLILYLQYAGFLIAASTLRFLPLYFAVKLGEIMARFFCFLSHRSSTFIEQQMRTCFKNRYTDKEYKKLVKKFYYHFGCLFAECVRLDKLNKNNINKYLDTSNFEEALAILNKKSTKGVFLATGHIGNWEFTGVAGALTDVLAGSIARPLDNPLIDRKVKEFREFSGQKIWDKEGALINIMRAIKNKKAVGILVDQDAGEQGLSIPFLGRPASTGIAIGDMALKTGAPILPIALHRINSKPMSFKIVAGEPIIPDTKNKSAAERLRILTEMNHELSNIIAQAPEQWLWTHKRWKTPNPVDRRFLSRYE